MRSAVQSLKTLVDAGLGLLYPQVCQICEKQRATAAQSFLCADCRAEVRLIAPPFCHRCGLPFQGDITNEFECANCRQVELDFSFARSAAVARGKLLDIIHRYKYQRALWFEPFLAELLAGAAGPHLSPEQWDWLVPVPLHPAKQREREFNQAERLARRLSLVTSIPVNTRLLRRRVATRTQTLLSREQRRENVQHAFALRGKPTLHGCRIVLIDDVFTTGATTGACARVLRRGGAVEVCVWTVGRGV